jgi:hypothetical protein
MKRSRWFRAAAVRAMTACQWGIKGSELRGCYWGEMYFILLWLGLGDCDLFEGVVDFAGLAIDLLDYDG